MLPNVVLNTNFEDINKFKQGKVRDMYDLGDHYLMISTDRLSAFDVIMNEGIPNKGKVLTKISEFWFDLFKNDVDNHLVSTKINEFPEICLHHRDEIEGRSMLVKKAELIPLEAIVRGHITGSGLKDYQKTGTVCGILLPDGLVDSDKLEDPIFTPSTKAEIGDHDENITEQKARDIIGMEAYNFIKETSLKIFKKAREYAAEKGIIIADTKMEFGYFDGKIILIDELLTPDSSRFWPMEFYQPGKSQMSFDKQYVRDYLKSINFNMNPPAPNLPEEVILNTSRKYEEALMKLTGQGI